MAAVELIKTRPQGPLAPQPVPSEPAASESVPSEIEGRLDAVSGGRVYGWARDRANPGQPVEVEIRLAGHLVAKGLADRPREDLVKGGFGATAFEFELPEEAALDQLAALARSAVTGAEAPIAVPSRREKELETALGPHLARVAAAIDGLRQDQRGIARQQQALGRAVTDLAGRVPAREDGAGDPVLAAVQALAADQRDLVERVQGLEVFIVRMDESLRALSAGLEKGSAGAAASAPRFSLAMALGALGGLVLVGFAALLVGLS